MDHILPLQPMPWTLARPPRFPLEMVVKLVEQEQLVLVELLVEQEEHMLQEQLELLVELEGMLELQDKLVLQDKLAEQAVLADMQEQVLLVAKEIVDSHSIHN